jgi:signal peptidase I
VNWHSITSLFGRLLGAKNSTDWVELFWTLVLILFLRAFVVEPFRIPTGSMIPTLLVGDHLFVAKGSYDLRIPFTNISVVRVSDPDRGDVIVFDFPNYKDEADKRGVFYIKRVVGVPGDKVAIVNGSLKINGQDTRQAMISEPSKEPGIVQYAIKARSDLYREEMPRLDGTTLRHWVQKNRGLTNEAPERISQMQMAGLKDCYPVGFDLIDPNPDTVVATHSICEFTVPDGKYFVMGDNRDESSDGRFWGFVDRSLIKGRALMIWLSWNNPGEHDEVFAPDAVDANGWHLSSLFRWSRSGLRIY